MLAIWPTDGRGPACLIQRNAGGAITFTRRRQRGDYLRTSSGNQSVTEIVNVPSSDIQPLQKLEGPVGEGKNFFH